MDSNTKYPVVKLSELNEESWNSFELGFRALCFKNKCLLPLHLDQPVLPDPADPALAAAEAKLLDWQTQNMTIHFLLCGVVATAPLKAQHIVNKHRASPGDVNPDGMPNDNGRAAYQTSRVAANLHRQSCSS